MKSAAGTPLPETSPTTRTKRPGDDLEEVVEVAADLAGRDHPALDGEARDLGEGVGQERGLELPGDLELLGDAGEPRPGDDRLAQVLDHRGQPPLLLGDAAREELEHAGEEREVGGRGLALGRRLLVEQRDDLGPGGFVEGAGELLHPRADQPLLTPRPAVALDAEVGELDEVAAEAGDGGGDSADLGLSAILHAHARVAAGEGVEDTDGRVERPEGPAEEDVHAEEQDGDPETDAGQRDPALADELVERSGRVAQRHGERRLSAAEVGDRNCSQGVAAAVVRDEREAGAAERDLGRHLLPETRGRADYRPAAGIDQEGGRVERLREVAQDRLGIAAERDGEGAPVG